ncbi:MAG: response regulator [Bacteroidetes bacterium]|nr:response regulator [Bacteroidota bacterium]
MMKQKRILVQLNVFASISCFAFFIYMVYWGLTMPAIILGIAALLYGGSALLARTGETGYAAVAAIIISNGLLVLFDTGFTDRTHSAFVLYIPLLLFSYVVTRFDEHVKRIIMVSITVGCILLPNFTNLTPKLLQYVNTDNAGNLFNAMSIITSAVVSLLMMRVVLRANHKMEQEMSGAKEVAETSAGEAMHFLSIMSHELRTPANAIVGMANLIQEKEVPANIKQDVSLIQYSAQSLLSIIENVLYFNKLESNSIGIEKTPFDIRKFCQNAVDSFVLEAAKKDIQLYFYFDDRIPPYLLCDHEKLTQIINNLLSNAIKFTRNGSIHFWVKLSHEDEEACYVMFKLADTGIGINPNRLKDIFHVFSQVKNKISRSHDGLGLGLAISRKLLEMMGSTIHVDSEEGEGSNFYFVIRLDRTAEVKDQEAIFSETHDLKGLRILLIEDNNANVLITTRTLQKMNAEIEVAKDGVEGIRMYTAGKYDLILMDLHMPKLDGFKTAAYIRETDTEIPILAYSADAFDDAKEKAKAAGMNDFISKPFDPLVLYDKISRNAPKTARVQLDK